MPVTGSVSSSSSAVSSTSSAASIRAMDSSSASSSPSVIVASPGALREARSACTISTSSFCAASIRAWRKTLSVLTPTACRASARPPCSSINFFPSSVAANSFHCSPMRMMRAESSRFFRANSAVSFTHCGTGRLSISAREEDRDRLEKLSTTSLASCAGPSYVPRLTPYLPSTASAACKCSHKSCQSFPVRFM